MKWKSRTLEKLGNDFLSATNCLKSTRISQFSHSLVNLASLQNQAITFWVSPGIDIFYEYPSERTLTKSGPLACQISQQWQNQNTLQHGIKPLEGFHSGIWSIGGSLYSILKWNWILHVRLGQNSPFYRLDLFEIVAQPLKVSIQNSIGTLLASMIMSQNGPFWTSSSILFLDRLYLGP